MRETQVQFLGLEDPLEKEMAIHSSTLAWKIPWTEQPDRLQSVGLQRVGHDWVTSLTHSLKLPISMVSLLRYTNTNMIKILSKWVTVSKVVLIFRLYYWSFFKKHRAIIGTLNIFTSGIAFEISFKKYLLLSQYVTMFQQSFSYLNLYTWTYVSLLNLIHVGSG